MFLNGQKNSWKRTTVDWIVEAAEVEVVAVAADAAFDPLIAALPESDKGLELTSELAPDAFDNVEWAPTVAATAL